MWTFSVLLALCAGNSLVTGEFHSQRPVTRSFDVFFDLCLNKRFSTLSKRRWFETPWRSLWHHSNVHCATWRCFIHKAPPYRTTHAFYGNSTETISPRSELMLQDICETPDSVTIDKVHKLSQQWNRNFIILTKFSPCTGCTKVFQFSQQRKFNQNNNISFSPHWNLWWYDCETWMFFTAKGSCKCE